MSVYCGRFSSAPRAGGNPARLIARVAAIAGLALGWLLVLAAPAWAHAELTGSTPANGQRLAVAPPEIRLHFTERVNLVRDGIRLLDASGAAVGTGPVRLGATADEVLLPVPGQLPDGVYTVTWRVVSGDSHPIHGAFVFSVGDAVAAPLSGAGAGTGADTALAAVFWLFRWLGYAGLALVGGGAVFCWWCWPAGWGVAGARRILVTGWMLSLASAIAVLLLEGPYGAGASLAQVADPALLRATLGTGYGQFVLARMALLVAGGLLAAAAARTIPANATADHNGVPVRWPRQRVMATAAALVLGVASPLTWSGAGHAAGDPAAMAVDGLHLAAMSAWLGGLVLLFGSVLRASGPAARPLPEVAAAVRRFSPLALACVGVLAATGAYQAWRRVGSTDALAGSAYGRLLLFKVAVIGLLLWLGALSNSAVRRGYARLRASEPEPTSRSRRRAARAEERQEHELRAGLRRSVRIEVLAAAAVLGVTSVLVSTPPGARPAPPAVAAQNVDVVLPLTGGGRLHVTVDPARVGTSVLAVALRDPAGADWDVPEVKAALELPDLSLGPLPVPLDRPRPGRYLSRALTLPAAGTWRLRISVRSSEIDEETVATDIAVAT